MCVCVWGGGWGGGLRGQLPAGGIRASQGTFSSFVLTIVVCSVFPE